MDRRHSGHDNDFFQDIQVLDPEGLKTDVYTLPWASIHWNATGETLSIAAYTGAPNEVL